MSSKTDSIGRTVGGSKRKGNMECHRDGNGRIFGDSSNIWIHYEQNMGVTSQKYGGSGTRYDNDGKYQGSTERDGGKETNRDASGRTESSSEPSKSGCFLTSACTEARGLPDDCLELTTLRTFRDSYLGQQPDGPAAIAHYYEVAPAIVERINVQPNAKEVYGQLFNELVVPCVELIQEGKLSEALTTYASAVMRLEREYL